MMMFVRQVTHHLLEGTAPHRLQGMGRSWVGFQEVRSVTVSLTASPLLRRNGVPPQIREGVASLTGARFPC